jgi:hypothetical protein
LFFFTLFFLTSFFSFSSFLLTSTSTDNTSPQLQDSNQHPASSTQVTPAFTLRRAPATGKYIRLEPTPTPTTTYDLPIAIKKHLPSHNNQHRIKYTTTPHHTTK